MVEVSNLWVEYPLDDNRTYAAVIDVTLTIASGEFFTLLGPSGCGKTSTLRSIAGLERPSRGQVRIGTSTVFDASRRIDVPAHRRNVSMVFQSYAIWPHLSVGENVAFPLEVAGTAKSERSKRVREALDLVGLAAMENRSATTLSGGQQQRVAIARGIVRRSPLVLLDEPLSNLDAKLREQMRVELRELLKRVGVTALYVTHDQEEALALSDRVAVMSQGRIIECGTPAELYLRPATRIVAQFLGQAELFAVEKCSRSGSTYDVVTEIGVLRVDDASGRAARAPYVMIRPEAMKIHRNVEDDMNVFPGCVTRAQFTGRHIAYSVKFDTGRAVSVLALPFDAFAVGDRVKVALPPDRLVGVGEVDPPAPGG